MPTPVGSSPDLVVEGVTGLLVARRDPAALADRLVTLVRDAGLRDRLGRAARQKALRDCSIKDNIADLERLYEMLCAKPATPDEFAERPDGATV